MKKNRKSPHVRSLITVVSLLALQSGLALTAFAEGGATGVGGGGDASEVRVNDIRVDILKWIAEGGDQGLKMPAGLAPKQYRDGMNAVLAQNQVVVAFKAEPVIVGGTEKTCRGFESATDRRLHIECNIARFKTTSDSDQYKLIHHEYAGLAGLERNDGAASDYVLSSQITEYLVREMVMKLAVKKAAAPAAAFKLGSCDGGGYNQLCARSFLDNPDGTRVIVEPRVYFDRKARSLSSPGVSVALGPYSNFDGASNNYDAICRRAGFVHAETGETVEDGCFAADRVVIGPTGAVVGLRESACGLTTGANQTYRVSQVTCSPFPRAKQ